MMNGNAMHNSAIRSMLTTHPQPGALSSNVLAQCVEACFLCAATCTACADACLAEEMLKELRQCIRLNLDCADICQATGRVAARQTEAEWRVLYHQSEACRAACRACAEVCEQHAAMHDHCRICAEACRACEQACDKLIATFPI